MLSRLDLWQVVPVGATDDLRRGAIPRRARCCRLPPSSLNISPSHGNSPVKGAWLSTEFSAGLGLLILSLIILPLALQNALIGNELPTCYNTCPWGAQAILLLSLHPISWKGVGKLHPHPSLLRK